MVIEVNKLIKLYLYLLNDRGYSDKRSRQKKKKEI